MAQNAPSGFFATPAQAGLRSRQGRHPNQKDAQAYYSGLSDGFISSRQAYSDTGNHPNGLNTL